MAAFLLNPDKRWDCWASFPGRFTYLLTYSLALQPSVSLSLPTYQRPFFPIHFLNIICRRFFSITSSHLNLRLPLLLLPYGLLSNVFITVLPWSILTTYPIHSSLGRFTPRKELRYPVSGRLGGTQSRSGRFVEDRSSLLLPGIEPRLLCFIPCTLVIVPTVSWSSIHVPTL